MDNIQNIPNTPISTDNKEAKEMIRLSISEAAKLFGVASQTIRRAIKSQEITYIIVGGRYKINFESLVKWSQVKTTIRNKSAQKGIGQYVSKWKIKNPLYSPNPTVAKKSKNKETSDSSSADRQEETNKTSA